MQILDQDILDITEGILCHQVNLQGKMGAGLALRIRKKYPIVYKRYLKYCKNKEFKLGMIHLVRISEMLYVCNLAGQEYYGRDKRYTDYDALRSCLSKVKVFSKNVNMKVYIPYGMGCNNAGGDWSVVSKIVESEISDAIICRYFE